MPFRGDPREGIATGIDEIEGDSGVARIGEEFSEDRFAATCVAVSHEKDPRGNLVERASFRRWRGEESGYR